MQFTLLLVLLAVWCCSVSSADKSCCTATFSKSQKAFLSNMLANEAMRLQSGMMQMCSKPAADNWVKLSPSPVCFSASGQQFGTFSAPMEGFLGAVKLVHVSGSVTCDQSAAKYSSKWGCHPSLGDGRNLNTLITKATNRVVFPCLHDLKEGGSASPALWYKLEDFDARSPKLVLKKFDDPVYVTATEELRLWYGEDLTQTDTANNGGQTCANIYGWYM